MIGLRSMRGSKAWASVLPKALLVVGLLVWPLLYSSSYALWPS